MLWESVHHKGSEIDLMFHPFLFATVLATKFALVKLLCHCIGRLRLP